MTQNPFEAPQVSDIFLRRLKQSGLGLLAVAAVFWLAGVLIHNASENSRVDKLQRLDLVQELLRLELTQLNQSQLTVPEPRALKALLELGQNINSQSQGFQWFGQLHNQKEQILLTQAIETLSRPVAGVNSSFAERAQREIALRLDTQGKLDELRLLNQQASNGTLVLVYGLASLLTLSALVLLNMWQTQTKTNRLARRLHALGRALQTQQEVENKRVGATSALEGVIAVLKQTQNVEHRHTLMQLGEQLESLKNSGHSVLHFARAFHEMSSQGTQLAKTALTSEQRNLKADSHMEIMRQQLNGLREDIRNAAQGLRRAGEVSRQLLTNLDPKQLQLALSEGELNDHLQKLVEQSQHALKESIEGLVLASQKINMGQFESNKLAEHMAINQTAWSNLLANIEQYAESASGQSEKALHLAKNLIQTSKKADTLPRLNH